MNMTNPLHAALRFEKTAERYRKLAERAEATGNRGLAAIYRLNMIYSRQRALTERSIAAHRPANS